VDAAGRQSAGVYSRPEFAAVVPTSTSRNPGSLPRAGLDPALLTPLRTNAHVLVEEWNALFSEGRIRTRMVAAAQRLSSPRAAASHTTAAAMHRLPLYQVRDDRVEMIVPVRGRRKGKDIVRHYTGLPDGDVVVIDGIRVTSLARTVYDVTRTASLEAAVVVFDASLRQIAWDDEDNTYDEDAAERFRERIWARIARNSGARGIRQARFVAEFADGRAQGPGESIARLWMWQLGLPQPQLQYRVDFADGSYSLLDFAWPELGRWAEFDGKTKYTDAGILAGRTPEDVLRAQQRREDKIREQTHWHCDRWGFSEMPGIDVFSRFLRSIGLHAVPAAARTLTRA